MSVAVSIPFVVIAFNQERLSQLARGSKRWLGLLSQRTYPPKLTAPGRPDPRETHRQAFERIDRIISPRDKSDKVDQKGPETSSRPSVWADEIASIQAHPPVAPPITSSGGVSRHEPPERLSASLEAQEDSPIIRDAQVKDEPPPTVPPITPPEGVSRHEPPQHSSASLEAQKISANIRDGQGKKEIPPDPRWTKISRRLVNPEALELGNENYEAREDFVIVLRVLSRDEVQEYAEVTQRIRGVYLISNCSYIGCESEANFVGDQPSAKSLRSERYENRAGKKEVLTIFRSDHCPPIRRQSRMMRRATIHRVDTRF